ncbi:MAG: cation transporting ATPase C-terminal domain-containing protein, partial [Promethearchaeota archaeon]
MVITDDSFSTIVTGIREGRGLFMKIRTILYFFVCISVMEAMVLFSGTFSSTDPSFAMWEYWQLNLLYVTAHMFPSLGFTFGNISKTAMQEKPRDSAEILTKQIFLIMLVQMVLMGTAIASVYYLSLNGIISLNSVNTAVEITGVLSQVKARTMAFLILFIMESFFLPLQIRRINHSFLDSVRDIPFNKEFLFYLPSVLILVAAIYIPSFQTMMGFMYLSASDWLICLGVCLPAIFGFEYIRKRARDRGYVF